MRPDVQRAAKRLVDATERVEHIDVLRKGLAAITLHNTVHADPRDPSHREALDAWPFWRALEELVTAVQQHKES